jgi:hypothetical protein
MQIDNCIIKSFNDLVDEGGKNGASLQNWMNEVGQNQLHINTVLYLARCFP